MLRLRRLDWWGLAGVLALMVIGVLFIYSACYRGDGLPVPGFYRRQIVWGGLGLAGLLGLAVFDYRRLGPLAWLFYAVAIALLILVLLVGATVSGAARWLNLFGILVQPSEFAKLATLFAMAWYLSRPGRDMADPLTSVRAALIALPPFVLIFREPDLGTAAVLVPVTFALLFAAGAPWRTLLCFCLLGLALLPAGWWILDEYQRTRLLVFFDAGRDPLNAGWNKIQSEIAVGSGGLAGKGFLAGTQNVLGFLPRTVAPTDFIYSVIAEEMGFAGSALVLSLYAAMLTGIVRTALSSTDRLGRLLSAGMAALVFSHVFVNIAMTVGLLPITGLPLPLISYGGSFMISTLAGLGLVQSVHVRRARQ